MADIDLPLSQLWEYRPDLTLENDFDSFWNGLKAESANKALNARVTLIDYPVKNVSVYDVVYDGADGTPVHGWYVVPNERLAQKPLPVVVHYHGYSGDRGKPHDLLKWASMGIAAFAVDTRGQGGMTPDYATYTQGGISGWMTLGILDPNTYYYKQVYLDCVRAVDFVCSREEIDTSRIGVYGGSQGGALTLAVAGLDDRPKIAMPVFPFLCHFRRSVEMHGGGPYGEIKNWFRKYDPEHLMEAQVYRTLSYFDCMNHASRVKAKTLMAITLQDVICPPSTCFAAYNHLPSDKEVKIYYDFGHEGLPFHDEAMMRFAADNL